MLLGSQMIEIEGRGEGLHKLEAISSWWRCTGMK